MAFLLSPGVQVRETDLTNIIPAVATSIGAYVAPFAWGPLNTVTTVSSEADLIEKFGRPTSNINIRSWYSAANFLGYTNNLKVVRVTNDVSVDANGVTTGSPATKGSSAIAGNNILAKYEGSLGNTLGTAVVNSNMNSFDTDATITTIENDFTFNISFNSSNFDEIIDDTTLTLLDTTFTITNTSGIAGGVTANDVANGFAVAYTNGANSATDNGDGTVSITLPNTTDALKAALFTKPVLTFAGINEDTDLIVSVSATSDYGFIYGTEGQYILYRDVLTSAPATDEVSFIVYDYNGGFTGTPGSILETFEFLSSTAGAKTLDGAPNGAAEVLNVETSSSSYISLNGGYVTSTATEFARIGYTTEGSDGDSLSDGNLTDGWDSFKDAERFDINIMFAGDVSATVQKHIVENIASVRKDCIAVLAPTFEASGSTSAVINHFNTDVNVNTSYAVLVSGWKRQYDRYNDAYIMMPTDADVAGLMARTDRTNDAWWSPAGLNRGQINNVVSLAFNPNSTDRDNLYKNGINPIVTLPGQGTVLFGDKTALARPSAFDRINVRRLFIVLEKAIATAAKFQLFEFNDDFTRANFVAAVEPFLRDIRARRGITEFFVKCDEENNTSAVIDRNEFAADIYIKPARSINFIRLNFVAVRSGVNFSEVVGR